MANTTLNNELQKYAEFDVYENDLFYQDAVMKVISSEKYDVLIVSALLQGELEFIDFIEKVKQMDAKLRIIVITDELSGLMKRKLMEYSVTDIFLDEEVTMSDIIDAIQREEPLRKKYEQVSKNAIKVQEQVQDTYDIKPIQVTQKQEIIAVSGINGAGKSTIAANFARVLASRTSSKVLLIDLDTLSGNLDEILEIHKVPQNVEMLMDEDKKCGLNYAAELIAKNRFDTNVFEELIIELGNVDVLTGNTSLHYCQNVLQEEYYQKILDCAKEKYDFIIIDTSSNIFLDSTKWALQVANKILFVTENNYLSMKKSTQFLTIITDIWGTWKEKVKIVVNKENSNGIDIEIVHKILENYEMVGHIKQDEQQLEISYSRILESIHYIPKVSIFSRFFAGMGQSFVTSNRLPSQRMNKERMIMHVN